MPTVLLPVGDTIVSGAGGYLGVSGDPAASSPGVIYHDFTGVTPPPRPRSKVSQFGLVLTAAGDMAGGTIDVGAFDLDVVPNALSGTWSGAGGSQVGDYWRIPDFTSWVAGYFATVATLSGSAAYLRIGPSAPIFGTSSSTVSWRGRFRRSDWDSIMDPGQGHTVVIGAGWWCVFTSASVVGYPGNGTAHLFIWVAGCGQWYYPVSALGVSNGDWRWLRADFDPGAGAGRADRLSLYTSSNGSSWSAVPTPAEHPGDASGVYLHINSAVGARTNSFAADELYVAGAIFGFTSGRYVLDGDVSDFTHYTNGSATAGIGLNDASASSDTAWTDPYGNAVYRDGGTLVGDFTGSAIVAFDLDDRPRFDEVQAVIAPPTAGAVTVDYWSVTYRGGGVSVGRVKSFG